MPALGFAVVLVLSTGLGTGCKYSTQKTPVLTNTGDNVGGGGTGSGGSGSFVAQIDPNCMTNAQADACIFLQNPFAVKGSPFTPAVTGTSDLRTYLTYAVQITGLTNANSLANASYSISPQSISSLTRDANGKWKYPYSLNCAGGVCQTDPNHKVAQLMAYYWLNFQLTSMTSKTGAFFAANKNIPVDPYIAGLQNAYWDSNNKLIALGVINNQDLAISAEIYLHEAGHANVFYGSMGNIEAASAIEGLCPDGLNWCCDTNKGCPSAINEGQADFHAGIIFPNDTALGEALTNTAGGLLECGLKREMAVNTNLTANQAFNACGGNTAGEIHVTGRVYASVWWEVRKAAANPAQIDTLFTEHLRVLTSTDDFETAAGKINTLDTTLFGGSHVAAFNAQWASRGLTPR